MNVGMKQRKAEELDLQCEIYNSKPKRERESNHEATSEFVDAIFTVAHKSTSIKNILFFYFNKVLQETNTCLFITGNL